jgi:hypothetical protein
LQFGDGRNLVANVVLLNPGSAVPVSDQAKIDSKIECIESDGEYCEFSLDPLMRNLLSLFANKYDGGVVRIYNLFNLKEHDSQKALEAYERYKESPYMHTPAEEICYGDAPVVIACGGNAYSHPGLVEELKKYISLADESQLYALKKAGEKSFTFQKASPDRSGLVDSYHPSYTFRYGNTTSLGELQAIAS